MKKYLNNINAKTLRIKILRIILSMILPLLLGIVVYSVFSGFYHEPLFGLGIILSLPHLFLLMLPILLIYTIVMEILGKTLIRKSNQSFFHTLIFLMTGPGIGVLYFLISDGSLSFEWIIVIFITGLCVSSMKLILHSKEKKVKVLASK